MIYLAGMMGAGKSTVGQALARRLRLPFVDLDQLIEKRASMSIPEIFGKMGEGYFRQLESQMLKETSTSRPAVVALGGGTLTHPENLRLVKTTGHSVYLRATVPYLLKNLHDHHDRPLLAANPTEETLKGRLEDLLHQRRASYETCDLVFDIGSEMSADDIAEHIAELLTTNGFL